MLLLGILLITITINPALHMKHNYIKALCPRLECLRHKETTKLLDLTTDSTQAN